MALDYQDRIRVVVERMEAAGLDAVIGFSAAAHHVDFGDAVALMTGVKPLGPSFAVLRRDGATELVVTPGWDAPRAIAQARIGDVVATDDLPGALAERFDGGRPGTLGTVDLAKMPHRLVAGFISAMGEMITDADDMVFGAAAQKTDEELANAREATRIAEETYRYLLEIAEPGMPECRLAAALKSYSRSIGADDNFMMFHAEGHPEAVQPSGERPLARDDLILAEITPSYAGQFAQLCRTVCLGAPSDERQEKYDLVVRAMANGIARARPGVAMREICLGVDEVLREAGYGAYCEPPYMNRRGHGLGMTSIAPGNVSLDNWTILEPGMFFVVHPNQYLPEVGYLLCGEPIIITDDGAEIVTRERAALAAIPC